jgi:fluoroacetyl-CoA thioesterase
VKPGLAVGARATFSRQVRREDTVPGLFGDAPVMDGMPEVLASAWMIGLFEWACVEQVAPFYEPGEGSLGIGFECTHVAATPPGLTVSVATELIVIDGRFLEFRVSGHDGIDLIGEGRHRRALVQWDRFNARLVSKRAAAAAQA